MTKELEKQAKRCAKAHIDACENWEHGGIDNFHLEDNGRLRIQYEDGSWWYYREHAGEVTWA